MILQRNSIFLIVSLITLSFSQGYALSTDSQQLMTIRADSVDVFYTSRVTKLIGNASVTQGSTKLTGAEITIYYTADNTLQKMVAHGSDTAQAQYNTTLDKNNSPFHASADIICYLDNEKLAIFSGNAHATQGGNTFEGKEFRYWTVKQEIKTVGSEAKQAKIILIPNSLKGMK